MPATEQSLADRVIDFSRTWWPVAAFLLPVLVVQTVWSARYDVAGHAADHLQSATPVFPMVFLSAVLLWALPGRGRRDPLLWLLLAAAIASCLVVLVGNVRVIDAIGGATWNDTQASQLGPTRPGFESGHDLAELGAWGAVVATMLVAGLLWLRPWCPQGCCSGGGGQPRVPPLHRSGRWNGRLGGRGSSGALPRSATCREPLTQPELLVLRRCPPTGIEPATPSLP